jgi:hypothetical protein
VQIFTKNGRNVRMEVTPKKPTAGFWHKPLRGTTILKAGSIVLAVFAIVLGAFGAFVSFSMKPPKETKVIEDFQVHRATYERLRDMLIADRQLRAVRPGYGVETSDSALVRKPAEVNFSVSRYDEYVALLKEIDRSGVFKIEDKQSNLVCVNSWGAGWAGDTRHLWLCWADREPANQVASLDAYYRGTKRSRNVFRRIHGNWYLGADW